MNKIINIMQQIKMTKLINKIQLKKMSIIMKNI